jgi:replicative DNA helicase Mcm
MQASEIEPPKRNEPAEDLSPSTVYVDWLVQCYHDQLNELADAYTPSRDQPLRGETIELSLADLKDYHPPTYDAITSGGSTEVAGGVTYNGADVTAIERVMELTEQRIDEDVDVGYPEEDGWVLEWVEAPDGLVVHPSEPLSHRIGELVVLRGRTEIQTPPQPRMRRMTWECKKCGTITDLLQSRRGGVSEPRICRSCEREPDWISLPEHKKSEIRDWQYLRVEELVSEQTKQSTPESMHIYVYGQSRCAPLGDGSRVEVVGRLKYDADDDETYIDASSVHLEDGHEDVEVTEEDREEIEEYLDEQDVLPLAAGTVAPTVFGEAEAKQGLFLSAIGSGVMDKPQLHTLLVGDTGTAKSELARDLADLVPHGRAIGGSDATQVGLTAAAVQKEVAGETRWTISSGAMAQMSEGVLTIDEINESDFSLKKLNDAMEEGIVSIAKAGINATVRTNCTVIATCNPDDDTDAFDPYEPLGEQIPLQGSVESRFSLMYPFVDKPTDSERNNGIAERVTAAFMDGECEEITREMPEPLAQKWIHLARQQDVVLRDEKVRERVKRAFNFFRAESGESMQVSARYGETVTQLAFAHARARLSDEVRMTDVEAAISIVSDMMALWGWDVEGASELEAVETDTDDDGDDGESAEVETPPDRDYDAEDLASTLSQPAENGHAAADGGVDVDPGEELGEVEDAIRDYAATTDDPVVEDVLEQYSLDESQAAAVEAVIREVSGDAA